MSCVNAGTPPLHLPKPVRIITPTGDDGVRELAQMWSKDENISEVNLSAHKMGPGAAEALGSALRDSLSITSVDCSLNPELGDEGARLLVPALRTDGTGISTIRMLSLMRCKIGDDGEEPPCCSFSVFAGHS